MKNYKKGFTLIELLVVIAIIGILASVVLASLSSARQKGQLTAIRADMTNMIAQMEIYFGANNNSWGANGGCTGTPTGPFLTSNANSVGTQIAAIKAKGATNVVCFNTPTAWWVTATMPDGTPYCIDSTGNATTSATVDITADFNCL